MSLQTVLETEIAKITDDITKELATSVLTDYLAARVELAASAGSNVTSYSVTGRSFTLGTSDDLLRKVRRLETELATLIQGCASLISMQGFSDESD